MKIILQGFLLTAVLLQAASFDAASIKPSEAATGNSSGIDTDNGLLRAHNVTLKRCIRGAYNVPDAQILGGPKWIDDLRFEIVARADHPPPGTDTMEMLQSLLAERFKLQLHHETRMMSGYALTVAKSGMKATPSTNEGSSTNSSRGSIDAKGCAMSQLAIKLSAVLGVPVTDMTDEKRRFDFILKWIPDEALAKSAASSDTPNGPSLFTALQEQLGLRLEARKIPLDVLLIDHAELPSEN